MAICLFAVAGCGAARLVGSSAAGPTMPDATALTQQTQGGQALPAAGWSSAAVVLSFSAPSAGEALVPEVEVAKAGQPFTGTPTAQGTSLQPSSGAVTAHITLASLAPGQYHWQARFSGLSSKQHGKWTAFGGGDIAFGVVGSPPTIAHVTLTGTAQSPDGTLIVNQQSHPSLVWTASAAPAAALDHFAYLADHQQQAAATPPSGSQTLSADTHSLDVNGLADGQWYLHLWALDKADQCGAPATVAVTVARTPPRISDVVFRSWATNPLYQTVPIHFTLSRAANVDVTILSRQTGAPVRVYHLGHQTADKEILAPWDGKDDHGHIVPTGSYDFRVDVVDDAGTHVQAQYDGLTIDNKVIRVSLSKQVLTAYVGSTAVLTTTVTTGGQTMPTPTGQFEILSKQSPFVFHSPFPKGSPYWYADVTSHQAMLFNQAGADFIHDAPWRTVFGPGSNGPGIPGSTFTGSHGCVELPASVMPKLYAWATLGTPVFIAN